MLHLAAACLLLVAADEDAAHWSYTVTDRGQPVAGAKVGLVAYISDYRGTTKRCDPIFATTDATGTVHFPRTDPSRSVLARLLARDRAGRGGIGTIWAGSRNPRTLELHDNQSLPGRVTDTMGKPIPGLMLKPVALGPEKFKLFYGRQQVDADTPDWFWEAFPVRAAADDSFTVNGVPVGYSVAVQFSAPSFGTGRFWMEPGRPAAIALPRAGAIALRFTNRGDAKPGALRVTADRIAAGANDVLEASATGNAGASAELTLAELLPGNYRIEFPYTGPAPRFPKAVATVTVKPGETTRVTTPLEPAARITVRFIDSKTGQGVAGARLTGTVSHGPRQTAYITSAKTGANGKVELLIPAGMVSVGPEAPDGYAIGRFPLDRFGSLRTEMVPIAPGQAHDFGTFALVKTVDLPGTVVDEAGRPVVGAKVFTGYSQTNSARGAPAVSGADGGFVLRGINPEGGLFGVTVRKGKLITAAPVAVDPAKPVGTIRVVVSEKFGAKLRLQVVDQAGQPIAGVGIDMMHSVNYLNHAGGMLGYGTGRRDGTTGADGRFESDIQQAGDRYQITLSGPGYRTSVTAEWEAKPGETHDFGDIVLARADLAVTGIVTDRTGKPVAGATVFDNADGPRPTRATTDLAGRFKLTGLYQGPAYVAVQATGFRLAAVPVHPGAPAMTVTLRRLSDPPAAPPVVSDAHKQAIAKLTRHLLEALWANRVAAQDDGTSILRAMARFDPATARQWRDEEKQRSAGKNNLTPSLEAGIRDRTLLATARDDPDEAVALLKPLSGPEGFRAVCQLATDLLPDSPVKAMRVAEEAVVRARGLEQADRAWALAQAGELVFRAGRKDAGRKLIEEATKAVAPLGFEDVDAYRRGMAACRLALYDPAKARAMIDPMPDLHDFNRWLRQCCVRRAEVDLPLAKKWLSDFRPADNSGYREMTRQLMALRLARTNPDVAAALARSIDHPMVRAVTYASLAVRIPDRARASRLIDEALDRIVVDVAGPDRLESSTAGLVLYSAKQVGHPDLASVRDKVLAARTVPLSNPSEQPNGEGVRLALTLALTDPETARLILAQALPLAGRAKIDGQQALIALALADPSSADALVDALVARAVQAKADDFRLLTRLVAVAEVLTQPDQLADNVCRYGGLYHIVEE